MTSERTTPRLFFRLPLDPARLLRARQRVRDYLHEAGVESEAIDDAVLSLEEAMTNAVSHSDAEQDLEVMLRFEGRDLLAEVRDCGSGFDVDSFDPGQTPDLMAPGGRGLFLMARLMDDLQLRCNGGLEVRLVKRDAVAARPKQRGERSLEAAVPGSQAYWDERQRAFLDEVDEAFVALDWEYRFAHVNPAYERLFHTSREATLGRTLWELFPLDHPAAMTYREAMELGRASTVEYVSPSLGRWIETRAYPTSSGISVYARDIDERKRRELERDEYLAALQASEEKYRTIVETTSDGVTIGSPDGTILFANQRMAEMLGYSVEELVGMSGLAITFEDEADAVKAARSELQVGRAQSHELRLRRKDGGELWSVYSAAPLLAQDGSHSANIVMHRDITDRRQADAKLKADLDALTMMHALSGALVDGAGMQPLLQDVMDAAVAVVDARFGTLQLLEGDSLRIVAHHNHQQAFLDFFAAAENTASVCGEATRRGERVVVADVESDPLFIGTPSLDVLLQAGVRAVQSTPLMTRSGSLLGILTTQWAEPHRPDEHDLWRIDLLARQASDLIETASSEASLRESERRLRIATAATGLGVQDYDVRSGAVTWDDRVRELWGIGPDEPVDYETFIGAVHPDDREAIEAAVQACMDPNGSRSSSTTYRIVNQTDGSLRWLRATWETLFDHDEPVRMIGTVEDITERRQAEERLSRQSQLLDLASDAIFAWELEGPIVYWNQGAVDLYGFAASDAVARVSHDLLATSWPEDLPSLKAALLRDGAWTGELFHTTQDDRRIVVESRMRLASLDGRQLVLETTRDITERKQAEQALREAQRAAREDQARVRATLDSLLDPHVLLEAVRDEEARIVDFVFADANLAACEFNGLRLEELVGTRLLGLHPAAGTTELFEMYVEVVESGEPLVLDDWAYPQDLLGGEVHRYDVRAARVGDGLSQTWRDVTERRQAEAALRERARLAAAQARVEALVHSSLDDEEIIQAALREGAEAIGAETAGLSLHEDAEGRFRVAYIYNYPPDKLGILIPDEADTHGVEAMRTGQTLAIDDTQTDPRVVRELMAEWDIKSVVCAPLIVRGLPIGVVYYNYHSTTHRFTDQEIDFVTALAASLASALHNARLYAEQSEIALTLQQAFVHPLPQLDGIELGLVGLSASQPALVGGDFWDAFELPDEKVLFVMGDVAGKGIKAAAMTETVHSTMRAFARIDDSPVFILRRTNELLLADEDLETFVTALVAVMDTRSGAVRLASAGHPGPIHVSSGGCGVLDPAYGPPLGAFPAEFASTTVELARGDALVLFTDGVTEARSSGRLFGEENAVDTVCAHRGQPVQHVADGLASAAASYADELRDDLQVLVVRRVS